MTPPSSIPLEARPTVKEARPMLGLGRWAMRRYMEGADKNTKLHPSDVMHLAETAHVDGRRINSLNEVALDLINYATEHAAAAVPAVTEAVDRFFDGRSSSTPI